jgi:hypothetical protein
VGDFEDNLEILEDFRFHFETYMKAVDKYEVTQTCNWARDSMANNDFITQASKFLMEFIARCDNSELFVVIYQHYTCCSLYFSYHPCVIVPAL